MIFNRIESILSIIIYKKNIKPTLKNNEQTCRALNVCDSVNGRMAKADFKGKFCNISVITIYFPTLNGLG